MKIISVLTDGKGNEFFVLAFPYHPQIVDAVKKIPSRKFNVKTKTWHVRADHQVIQYIEVFGKYFEFEVDSQAQSIIDKFKIIPSDDIEIPTLKMQLRPFQKLGVSKAIKFERCIIADDMGLGKTCESIASVESLNAYPCLVVTPATLKLNWQKEINMWVDKTSLIVNGGKQLESYDADFLIINYDILEKHMEALKNIKFKSIIGDEFQYIKGHKSIRSKSFKKIAKGIKYRFALSGTPLMNRPKELIPQLDALDRLDSFGGFWTFAKRYCGAEETDFGWSFGNATNLNELHTKLEEMCMIRRLKSDVLKELPPKQRTMIPIEINNRGEYTIAVKDFSRWVRTHLINQKEYKDKVNAIKNLTSSQKKLLIEAMIKNKVNKTLQAEALAKIEYLKQITVRGKMIQFKEFIDNALEQDMKLVVFATHIEIQKELWDYYKDKNSVRIFAEDSLKNRDESVQRFQTDDSCRLMIASLQAGGIGITLTKSSTVIFIEFGWTPAIHDQAEDRCHRIGQTDSVNCYYLYGKDTIDESILELIEKKRHISDAVMDGKEFLETDNDVEEIISKFV